MEMEIDIHINLQVQLNYNTEKKSWSAKYDTLNTEINPSRRGKTEQATSKIKPFLCVLHAT